MIEDEDMIPVSSMRTLLASFVLLLIAIAFANVPAHAQRASNDVRYSSILDYSNTNILLSQGGFVATTTYNCNVATLNCTQVSKNTNSLLPSVLSNLSASSTYKVSPDYAYALVTTYTPGSAPRVELDSIVGDSLLLKATLPPLNGLVTGVRWAPNGTIIISESDGTTQKYNIATQALTSVSVSIPTASWMTVSPDARYVAYYLPNTVSNPTRTFGVVDTVAGKTFTLAEPEIYWDLLSEGVREFAFSPDSTKLLYLDDRSGNQTLYEVNLSQLSKSTSAAAIKKAMQGTQITSKPYQIADMQWLTNSSIIFSANRTNPLQWAWYTLNLNTLAVNKIADSAAYNSPLIKFGNLFVLQTADANGRETRVYNPATHTLSTFPLPGVSSAVVASSNQIVKAGTLSGVYLAPQTATSTLVVWLHGGPDRQAAVDYHSYLSYGGYDWMLNQLQANGVGVLKLDYPGSTGYGMKFATALIGGVGTADMGPTMAAINAFAKAHNYSNIYVIGNSYGGYLALKLLVSNPAQIAGAMSLSGVTDWPSLIQNIPSSIFSVDFNGPPNATNAALYANASIINNINALSNQKVVLFQGDADSEVPFSQSVLLNDTLAAAQKNVSYTVLPGEDHIYLNPASYTAICNGALNLVGLASSTNCTMR
jgi:dipeptidyl aminopeptidase/acylaminoacyl peptidase